MIELIPVEMNYNVATLTQEPMKTTLEQTLDFYEKTGFLKPWISYLAQLDGRFIGICAFKGAPKDNRVEVAYCTFPDFEGKGYAAGMCEALVQMALAAEPSVTVTARTLPEENASTSILRKNGFLLMGTVNDPEDGEVYEWVYSR